METYLTDEEAYELFVYDNDGFPVYRYEAPVDFRAQAHQRYWFSAVGVHNPVQPSWFRADAWEIRGCQSMFRSYYFGFPDWIELEDFYSRVDASQEVICAPYVAVDHTLLDTTEDENTPIPIEAVITGDGHALDTDRIWIECKIEPFNTWIQLAMEYQGGGHWLATIPGQSQPSELSYYIHAEDIIGRVTEVPSGGRTNPHPFDVAWVFDPFEEESGWIVDPDGDDDATGGQWERADPELAVGQPKDDHTVQGTLCWVTDPDDGYHGFGLDVDRGSTTLQSPSYDLTGTSQAVVKYWRWYSNNLHGTTDDTWNVRARNNGGDWVDVENTGQASHAWILIRADLNELFGEALGAVEFRFVASDSGWESTVEAAIDDFVLLVDFQDPQAVEDALMESGGLALHGATPNPFRIETSIRFDLAQDGPVHVGIYDVTGRRIQSLFDGGTASAGSNTVIWRGTDDSGRRVRSGVYYVRLEADGVETSRPVTFVR
jgi:hypothetical protein